MLLCVYYCTNIVKDKYTEWSCATGLCSVQMFSDTCGLRSLSTEGDRDLSKIFVYIAFLQMFSNAPWVFLLPFSLKLGHSYPYISAVFSLISRSLVPVTQLYVSVDASTKDSLKKIDRPLFKDFWPRFLDSLRALGEKVSCPLSRFGFQPGGQRD